MQRSLRTRSLCLPETRRDSGRRNQRQEAVTATAKRLNTEDTESTEGLILAFIRFTRFNREYLLCRAKCSESLRVLRVLRVQSFLGIALYRPRAAGTT